MSLKWKIVLYVALALAVIGLILFAGWRLSALFGGVGLAGFKMLQKKNDEQAKEEEKVAEQVKTSKEERENVAEKLEDNQKDRQEDIKDREERAETLEERLNSHLEGDNN